MSEAIVIQSAKGYAMANAWVNAVTSLSQVFDHIGHGKVEVFKTGLKLNEELSDDEAADSLAYITHANDKSSEIRTTLALVAGDLILELEKTRSEDEVENLIAQVSNEMGKTKNVIMEYKRTCKWLREIYGDDPSKRPDNLSITHWIELKNGSRNRRGEKTIPDNVLMDIIDKVSGGTQINHGVVDSDGNPVEQSTHLSCEETREMLNEAKVNAGTYVPRERHKPQRYIFIQKGKFNNQVNVVTQSHEETLEEVPNNLDWFYVDLKEMKLSFNENGEIHTIDISQ